MIWGRPVREDGANWANKTFTAKRICVMGSFSKTFATNGGFVASDGPDLVTYMKMYSTPFMFSNALSPIGTAIALEAARIVQSPKGDELRAKLFHAVNTLRARLTQYGLSIAGKSMRSLLPVLIGTEVEARRAHRITSEKNLAAMILEYPVVPLGSTRYRLQTMATHTEADAKLIAKILSEVMQEVRTCRARPNASPKGAQSV